MREWIDCCVWTAGVPGLLCCHNPSSLPFRVCLPLGHGYLCLQTPKSVLSVPNKDTVHTQNDMERLEIREQTKSKSEAKWKYKVRVGVGLCQGASACPQSCEESLCEPGVT